MLVWAGLSWSMLVLSWFVLVFSYTCWKQHMLVLSYPCWKKNSLCRLSRFWSLDAGLSWFKLAVCWSWAGEASLGPAKDQCIDQLRTSLNQLRTIINQLRTITNQLKTSINQLKTSINQLRTSINQLRTSINQLRTSSKQHPSFKTYLTSICCFFNSDNLFLGVLRRHAEIRQIYKKNHNFSFCLSQISNKIPLFCRDWRWQKNSSTLRTEVV